MAKPKTSKRYTREFRQELIALHRAGRSIPELSREFGPTPWTISLWVKQADRDTGHGDGGLTTNEREELARLRRENKRLMMEREILSKAAAWLCVQKVDMFSRKQTYRGNSQDPVAWIAEWRETETLKPIDKPSKGWPRVNRP